MLSWWRVQVNANIFAFVFYCDGGRGVEITDDDGAGAVSKISVRV